MDASFSTDLPLLLLLFLSLSLRSFIVCHFRRSSGWGAFCLQSAARSVLLIYLSTIPAMSASVHSPMKHPMSEFEDMKFQVNKLESVLEEKSMLLDSRILEFEQSKKMIEEMDRKIEFLHGTLNDIKALYGASSVINENIRAMNDEVQHLWDKSRWNNFNIHVSESKILESVKRMEKVASKVEKMQSIINEQWIQIQQLEQSLQMTKVMTSRVNKKASYDGPEKRKPYGCPMSRLAGSIAKHSYSKNDDLPDCFFLGSSIPKFSLIKATNELKRIMSAAQKKHHELQYMVKQVLEMHHFIAPLAHREFIFLVASMIIMIPLMMAWVVLYSTFAG